MDTSEFLSALARDAGAVLRRRYRDGFSYSEKARWDLVSEADLEVEELIASHLRRHFPADAFVSEEGAAQAPDADRRWIVDPLDGTANFVFGVPHFAVSVALEVQGQVVAGVVYNPVADELYLSCEEGVSLLNGRRITCSERDSLADALVAVGVSLIPANLERVLREWRSLFDVQRKGLPLLSPALNLCNVARGRTDVFLDFGSEMTGHAAGAFIVQNAGGTVTNYDFTPWDHRSRGVVASGQRLHPALAAMAGRAAAGAT